MCILFVDARNRGLNLSRLDSGLVQIYVRANRKREKERQEGRNAKWDEQVCE